MDFNNVAAILPPEGQTANLHSPISSAQIKFFIVFSIGLALSTFALSLRIYTRIKLVAKVGLDDYAVVFAWFITIAALLVTIFWSKHGFGQHIWNLSINALLQYLKLTSGVITTYSWALAASKISLLLTYLRINPNRSFIICTYMLIITIFCYTLICNIISVTMCRPTNTAKSKCLSDITFWQGVLNLIADGITLALPLPMVYKLRMRLAQKISLVFIFLGGSVVVIASIVRVVLLHRIAITPDSTWKEVDVSVWSVVEINIAIICNSLITIRPLMAKLFGRKFGSTENSRTLTDGPRFRPMQSSLQRSRDKSDSYVLNSMDEPLKAKATVTTEITVTHSDEESHFDDREAVLSSNTYSYPQSRVQRQVSITHPSKAYQMLGKP